MSVIQNLRSIMDTWENLSPSSASRTRGHGKDRFTQILNLRLLRAFHVQSVAATSLLDRGLRLRAVASVDYEGMRAPS